MASPYVLSTIAELESSSTTQPKKSSGYRALLEDIAVSPSSPQLSSGLVAFIDSILGECLGIVAARPLLNLFVETLQKIASSEVKVKTGQHALQALESRVVSFEEQDASIRELLADAYQDQEDYVAAAKVLQGIQLESSQRKVSDDEKVRTWIRICRLYLEEDDTTRAESYLNRAKNLLYKVDDKEISLMFQLSQARILDARRKFLDASQVYHSFSFSPILDEEERTRALSSAIICAVLAPAGPLHSRALGKLFKDERATQVEEFGMLEKMFLERLLSPTEIAKFADKLAPHQLAQTADGSTVLAKAVTEHNLLGVSRLYNNIGLAELGILLGLDGEKSEVYASRMLEQGRLNGTIDQIEGVIFFQGREQSGKSVHADQHHLLSDIGLRRWDSNVQGLSEEVERVTTQLQSQFPVKLSSPLQKKIKTNYLLEICCINPSKLNKNY